MPVFTLALKLLSATIPIGKGRGQDAVRAGAPVENTNPPEPPNTFADPVLFLKAPHGTETIVRKATEPESSRSETRRCIEREQPVSVRSATSE